MLDQAKQKAGAAEKAAETKSAESKPAEAKSAEAKPAEAKPSADRLTRYEIFRTGESACWLAIAPPHMTATQESGLAHAREENAKRLARVGATWPAYPAFTGDDVEDQVALLVWHGKAMAAFGTKLDGYADADQMLVVVAHDTCTLARTFGGDPHLDQSLASLEDHARVAQVDPALLAGLMAVLRQHPGVADAARAIIQFDDAVLTSLEAERAPVASAKLSRHDVFWTGFSACLTAMDIADATPRDTKALTDMRDENAKRLARLGVSWEPYLKPTGAEDKDNDAAVAWHMRAMQETASKLDAMSDRALLSTDMQVCAFLRLYSPDSRVLEASVGGLERQAKMAGIDPALISTVGATLRARPSRREAYDAVMKFAMDVSTSLEHESPSAPFVAEAKQ